MERYFNVTAMTSEGCQILIEDKSTNCFANAVETRKVLEEAGVPTLKTCIVVQDPTMALRTVVSFEGVYSDVEARPTFLSCPVFVPRMQMCGSKPEFAVADVPASELWEVGRFYDLIMGEIPRLRDDKNGYGPRGKGSIPHVDIPAEVGEAWARLRSTLETHR